MAVEAVIENAERINNKLTLNGTVKRGDLLGHNGTNWVKADCNVAAGYYAEYVAMEAGESGEIIPGCKSCVLSDEDAPYTKVVQYLSGTAGAMTATMPAVGGDLIQVVGMGMDTKRVHVELQTPRVIDLFFNADVYDTTGEPGLGVIDAGWTGPDLDADGEDAYIKGRLPSNMVSLLQARILFNSTAMTAIDVDLTITGAYDAGANNEDTGTAQTTAGLDGGAADNKIAYIDIAGASHLMDAGFALPGRNFSVSVDMDGVTGGTAMVLGVSIRCLVV